MIRLCLFLIALALPVHATQDAWPSLHAVVGVAADDVLNVRDAPSARAGIVGSLAPDATGIEVIRLSDDQRWGLVNTGERSGWVSMAYMQRLAGQYDGAPFPVASCFGTEPFWDLEMAADWTLRTPAGVEWRAPAAPLAGSVMRRDRHGAVTLTTDGRPVALLTVAQACTDGMSDRAYGLGVSLMVGTGQDMEFRSGCCTLQSR